MRTEETDLLIIGAGAAGLMAAIWAGRSHPGMRITVLDGARRLGAKILVAGGGRCNVTHEAVVAQDFAGASPNAIRKVLQRFDVEQTQAFFRELGVTLKREETGKLFPVTDDAHTVLDALLRAVESSGAVIRHPRRVEALSLEDGSMVASGPWGQIRARAVIMATGGRALPKSGSDGLGYSLVQSLGHTLTDHITPALVPLTLPREHFLTQLSGLAHNSALELRSSTGKRLKRVDGPTLCTHFGLSGPAVLDISRHFIEAGFHDQDVQLCINWLPAHSPEEIDTALQGLQQQSILRWLTPQMPERLARSLCEAAGIDANTRGSALTRDQRRALVQTLSALPLPVSGNRGYTYAEVTAGGVPLTEMQLKTMESRIVPGLYFCGEICDVDGRIGGFNFQWAWASGYVAGSSAAASLA